jgi:Do/DeqQ family serine protease
MERSLHLVASLTIAVLAGLAVPLPGSGQAQTAQAPAVMGVGGAPARDLAASPALAVPGSREAIRLSFAPVVKHVAPAVVNVYATARAEARSPFAGDPFFERFFGDGGFGYGSPRERARSSLGSGVIVDASGGIVTNNHVISGATEVKVALADGREFPAEILLRDERTDLAVLKIENGDEVFPALQFADSDGLEVGDLVLAVGNPFGVGQTVTSGIVSAVARTNLGISDSGSFIQTDAAINPGNSGGALVDLDGALVGINTAIFSRSGGSIGIGFAIPSNMVKVVVAQAIAGSTSVARPWIGVSAQAVTPDIAVSLGLALPKGALVTRVDENSPGAAAGLRVGDLILRAAGREVENPAALDYRLAVAGLDTPVELEVWRDGGSLALTVAAAAEPEIDENNFLVLRGRSPLSGAVVTDFSTILADRLGLRGADDGAVIVDVERRSPAARMGLRPGDVIIELQGEAVQSAKQLADLVEAGGRVWRLSVNRNGRVSDLVVGG